MKQMKFYFIAHVLIFVMHGFNMAQDKNQISVRGSSFEIILENKDYKFIDKQKNHFTIRDYYDFTDESLSGMFKLPSREIIVAIPPESNPKISLISSSSQKYSNIIPALNPKLELENDSTIKLTEVEYSDRVSLSSTVSPIEVKGFFWLRDFYCVHIKINTHIFDERSNVIAELKDINLRFEFENRFNMSDNSPLQIKSDFDENLKIVVANSGIAEQFRSNPKILLADTTGSWINYSANYLRIGTASDGLFRITKQDLENYGVITSGINPKTFQLFEYGTEKPIFVFGESDLLFDNGDYIEFFGTKNYSKISARIINTNKMPYNNYLDKYTDTTIYFLTWGTSNGLRAKENNIFQPSATDSLTYFTSVNHYESNPMDVLFYTFHNDLVESQFPFWDTGKGWYWRWLAPWATPSSFTISASDIVPDKNAKFYGKLQSYSSTGSSNVHLIKLLINDNKIDSQLANRYQRVLLQGLISTNSLINGNNTLDITYSEAGGAGNGGMLIDWVEAEYPRRLKLQENSLYFEFRDITTTTMRIVKIESIPDTSYLLYKVKPDFQKITAFNVINGNLYFTDTVSNENAYYLVEQKAFSKPIFFKYKTFTNLRNQNNQVDYIGITHPVFATSVTDYVNYISANFSVTANVFLVEDIFDEFGYGYPTAEAIREFVLYKFQSSPTPKPSYLVLFGDANYDYKKYRTASQGIIGGGNFVPSFGYPVSDQFYAIWDSIGVRLPQMSVGRIPLNKSSEMDFYKSKVQNNINKPFDDWNKKYLFFSGGRANYPEEIALYKFVNDSVINNFLSPPPLAGTYYHFYKTTNPLTDFGPYPPNTIKAAIEAGAVFISYIGHSGTATWDNSISEVKQLKNTVNRNPIISDFGCSTNKFAEPDIIAFGERFVLDGNGQALAYIGNSALGFVSTAIKGPGNFYKSVIQDTLFQIGKAHLKAKYLMFQQLGSSNVVNEFSFANTLMGDPAIKIQIPHLPNLVVKNNDILFETSFINDELDSIEIKLVLNNYGTVVPDSFKMEIVHYYQSAMIEQIEKILSLPTFKDTISFWVETKNKPGRHTLEVNLDSENIIDEIYESDNVTSVYFDVSSSTIRDLFVNRFENPILDSIVVLSPTAKNEKSPTMNFQLADNEDFLNFQQSMVMLDTFATNINFQAPATNSRIWLRYKIEDELEWSSPLTYSKLSGSKYFLGDLYSWNKQNLADLRIVDGKVELTSDTVNVSIISAGAYSGSYCLISKNGINLLSNTFFTGIGIVVLDENTLDVDTTAWFDLFNNPAGANSFAQLVNSIPTNKLVALGVANDAKNNNYPNVNAAVLSLGGTRFPSLQFKAPYALFGKKGADSTQVKQLIKNPVEGPITLDTNQVTRLNSGIFTSTSIGPSSQWKKLKVSQTIQNNSEIKFRPLGIKRDETVDTLSYLIVNNNEVDLDSISASMYPYLKMRAEFKTDSLNNSPKLSALEVDYKGVAELGTNFKAVTLNRDTLEQGQKGKISFYVYNAGEATASDFKVFVDVIRPDNSSEMILDQQISSLAPGERKLLTAGFITEFEAGDRIYKINIDPNNQVFEYYKDNNIYSVPFFIKRDTTKPIINITFDDKDIMDGDYVSPNPKIRMELSEPSLLPINDTSSLTIEIDDSPIYYSDNNGSLSYWFNPNNPKMVVEYEPVLKAGEHTIKVYAKDVEGNVADSLGLEKRFVVSDEMKMLYIYNYPNPVKDNTYFTFRLTQIPDEIKIMVYTIAGRLVKEIVKTRSELTTDFNKIFWDCRDEDGDLLGNGTYLYKVVMSAGDKTETSVHKLAIVR